MIWAGPVQRCSGLPVKSQACAKAQPPWETRRRGRATALPIGVAALEQDYGVATLNRRHFEKIPESRLSHPCLFSPNQPTGLHARKFQAAHPTLAVGCFAASRDRAAEEFFQIVGNMLVSDLVGLFELIHWARNELSQPYRHNRCCSSFSSSNFRRAPSSSSKTPQIPASISAARANTSDPAHSSMDRRSSFSRTTKAT